MRSPIMVTSWEGRVDPRAARAGRRRETDLLAVAVTADLDPSASLAAHRVAEAVDRLAPAVAERAARVIRAHAPLDGGAAAAGARRTLRAVHARLAATGAGLAVGGPRIHAAALVVRGAAAAAVGRRADRRRVPAVAVRKALHA